MNRFYYLTWIWILVSLSIQGNSQEAIHVLHADSMQNGKLISLVKYAQWEVKADLHSPKDIPGADSGLWKTVDPRLLEGTLPDNWQGMATFKTVISVDTSLTEKDLALFLFLQGAAEIYINDTLISTAGEIGLDQESERSVRKHTSRSFRFSRTGNQYILIRYSNFNAQKLWNKGFSGLNSFIGFKQDVERGSETVQNNVDEELNRFNLIAGFLLALAILHLVFFIYDPGEKANLTGALLFFALAGIFLSGVLSPPMVSTENYIRYQIGEMNFMALTAVVVPFFLYHAFNIKMNWLPLTVMAIGLVILTLIWLDPFVYGHLANNYLFTSMAVGIGLIGYAKFKLKRPGMNIILFFYAIAFIMLLPGLIHGALGYLILWGNKNIFMNLASIVAATGYSFFLARKVAVTNRQLKMELQENERLTSEKLETEREKQHLIEKQKEVLEKEVADRTLELRRSLEDLKQTQAQLVQQEKLASLGELTAGIAHEIKNPLNFVNNFSEVSLELMEELIHEVKTQSIASHTGSPQVTQSQQIISELMDDIQANLAKILQHGSRANSIVSSMLQHSRGGSGKKEPTNVNALIKEYVNLAFHGMRAGKNPINVDIQLELDETLGDADLIAEDFSRVVVNLCNNAFDAMRQKSKTDPGYLPILNIRTKHSGDSMIMSIEDNGPGIPEDIRDKILQPFFTTKKGTEGTGLGLSITHDIIKAHGGEIKINTKENSGTEFIIHLPLPSKHDQ